MYDKREGHATGERALWSGAVLAQYYTLMRVLCCMSTRTDRWDEGRVLTPSFCARLPLLYPLCRLTKGASRGRVIYSRCFLVVRWIFKGTVKGAGTYCMSENGRKQGFRRNLPPSPPTTSHISLYAITPILFYLRRNPTLATISIVLSTTLSRRSLAHE